MKKIIINPHNCSREELEELKNYLSDNSWDFKDIEEEKQSSLKEENITYIKKIINKYGSFTTADVEADSSPCIASVGNGRNVSQLVESFYLGYAEVVTYVHDTETNTDLVPYEDFDEDVIADIMSLTEDWEADQLQTEKRIS